MCRTEFLLETSVRETEGVSDNNIFPSALPGMFLLLLRDFRCRRYQLTPPQLDYSQLCYSGFRVEIAPRSPPLPRARWSIFNLHRYDVMMWSWETFRSGLWTDRNA